MEELGAEVLAVVVLDVDGFSVSATNIPVPVYERGCSFVVRLRRWFSFTCVHVQGQRSPILGRKPLKMA